MHHFHPNTLQLTVYNDTSLYTSYNFDTRYNITSYLWNTNPLTFASGLVEGEVHIDFITDGSVNSSPGISLQYYYGMCRCISIYFYCQFVVHTLHSIIKSRLSLLHRRFIDRISLALIRSVFVTINSIVTTSFRFWDKLLAILRFTLMNLTCPCRRIVKVIMFRYV
jgi:hypothetical protein